MGIILSQIIISNNYFDRVISKKKCKICDKLIIDRNCFLKRKEILCKCIGNNSKEYSKE